MFDFNKDYLYHASNKLDAILKSGFILSKEKIGGYYNIPCGFNSNNYISLSKKVTNKFDLKRIVKTNIDTLKLDEIYDLLNIIDDLEESNQAFYRYAALYPTFIFNCNIGEIKTNFIYSEDTNKYKGNNYMRYSNLLGEFHIKDLIDIKTCVAVALPYEINMFRYNLENQIRKICKKTSYDTLIKIYKLKTLSQFLLIENYLPDVPIIDISSQKVLTKSLFNDII